MLKRFVLVALTTVSIVFITAYSRPFQDVVEAESKNSEVFEGTWQSQDGRRLRIDHMGAYLSIREIRKNGSYGQIVNAVLSKSSSKECGTQDGWFYDDPTENSKVRICPGRCASLITDIAKRQSTELHEKKGKRLD